MLSSLNHYLALLPVSPFAFCLRLDSSPPLFLNNFFEQNLKFSQTFHVNPELDVTKLL